MFWKSLLVSFFLHHRRIKYAIDLTYSWSLSDKEEFHGNDMRYNKTSDVDRESIINVTRSIEKMKLKNTLENPAVSINQKIRIIERDKPKIIVPKLKAGGLFKDWENK